LQYQMDMRTDQPQSSVGEASTGQETLSATELICLVVKTRIHVPFRSQTMVIHSLTSHFTDCDKPVHKNFL